MERERSIGVFDSGLGGLTVLKEMISLMPAENTVYLGDTARVPYGTRSPETVARYSLQNSAFLMGREIKLLVVACNTVTATALPLLEKRYAVPVVGVIEPGARAAVRETKNGRIGVIGTAATVNSGAYERVLGRLSPGAEVVSLACPLFVPLAEEGWAESDVALLAAHRYLDGLAGKGIDTLLLGCTHYPLLKGVIGEVMGPGVTLVDSGEETARRVMQILREKGLAREGGGRGAREYFVTDLPGEFAQVSRRFLGEALEPVTLVDINGGGGSPGRGTDDAR